jgi:hypothetical protein
MASGVRQEPASRGATEWKYLGHLYKEAFLSDLPCHFTKACHTTGRDKEEIVGGGQPHDLSILQTGWRGVLAPASRTCKRYRRVKHSLRFLSNGGSHGYWSPKIMAAPCRGRRGSQWGRVPRRPIESGYLEGFMPSTCPVKVM